MWIIPDCFWNLHLIMFINYFTCNNHKFLKFLVFHHLHNLWKKYIIKNVAYITVNSPHTNELITLTLIKYLYYITLICENFRIGVNASRLKPPSSGYPLAKAKAIFIVCSFHFTTRSWVNWCFSLRIHCTYSNSKYTLYR